MKRMKSALAEKEQWFRQIVRLPKERVEWRWQVEKPTVFPANEARSADLFGSPQRGVEGLGAVGIKRQVALSTYMITRPARLPRIQRSAGLQTSRSRSLDLERPSACRIRMRVFPARQRRHELLPNS